MGLIAKDSGGGDFQPAPEGTHVAICCQVIDLGTQYDQRYNKAKHKTLIGWELPNEKDEDGKPQLVWERYTCSLSKKAHLRLMLESWRGKQFDQHELDGFDLRAILGKPCMVNILHNQKGTNTYANVHAVMSLPKGTTVPQATLPQVEFDIDRFDHTVFETFSDTLKNTILNSVEMRERTGGNGNQTVAMSKGQHQPIAEDDIPF